MAQLFTSLYQMTVGPPATQFNAAEMNTRWQSLDNRLNVLELNNVLTFYIPGALVVSNLFRFPWPFRGRNISGGLAVNTAPTGAAILCQLTVGGVDVFAAAQRPTIADGAQFGTFSVDGTNLALANIDQPAIFQVDQIGSGVAGSDLAVILRSEKSLT